MMGHLLNDGAVKPYSLTHSLDSSRPAHFLYKITSKTVKYIERSTNALSSVCHAAIVKLIHEAAVAAFRVCLQSTRSSACKHTHTHTHTDHRRAGGHLYVVMETHGISGRFAWRAELLSCANCGDHVTTGGQMVTC